jgi:hypothetical protein
MGHPGVVARCELSRTLGWIFTDLSLRIGLVFLNAEVDLYRSFPADWPWVPHIPGFPVNLGGAAKLNAAFLNESRTRGRLLVPRTGNPGISLVFREMWETTAPYLQLSTRPVR